MVNGQWSMVNGQWSMVNGQWSMVNGQWSIKIELRSLECVAVYICFTEVGSSNSQTLIGFADLGFPDFGFPDASSIPYP